MKISVWGKRQKILIELTIGVKTDTGLQIAAPAPSSVHTLRERGGGGGGVPNEDKLFPTAHKMS